jgi:hypothetical protein
MKLYHASPIENKENILEYGIYSNESDKISNDERLSGSYVFGFNNMADAINFITDNTSDYVIFSFEVPDYDVIQDTEYEDGCAFAVDYDIAPDKLVIEKEVF